MKRLLLCLLLLTVVGCSSDESTPASQQEEVAAASPEPSTPRAPTETPEPTLAPPTTTPQPPTATPEPSPTPSPEPTETAPPPTPTSEPTPLPYSDERVKGREVRIYLPDEAEAPQPTLLVATQLSFSLFHRFGEELRSRGYAVVILKTSLGRRGVEQAFCTLGWMHADESEYPFDMDRVVMVGEGQTGWTAETIALADDSSLFLSDCDYTLPEGFRVRGAAVWQGFHLGRNDPNRVAPNDFNRIGSDFATVDISPEEVDALWAILNVTAPQAWRTLDVTSDPLLSLVPYLPTYWADANDPPLWLSRPAPNPYFFDLISLFIEDMEALGLDVTVREIPCGGQLCNGAFMGFSLSHWENFPRLINALDEFLIAVLGGE